MNESMNSWLLAGRGRMSKRGVITKTVDDCRSAEDTKRSTFIYNDVCDNASQLRYQVQGSMDSLAGHLSEAFKGMLTSRHFLK